MLRHWYSVVCFFSVLDAARRLINECLSRQENFDGSHRYIAGGNLPQMY